MSETPAYIHGFTEAERDRLRRQARVGEAKIYRDVDFSGVRNLLEVGCGVGAQTEVLLRRFPDLHVTGIDRSASQLEAAREHLATMPWLEGRHRLLEADATALPFEPSRFDGAFLCWVLEHIPAPGPARVLGEVRRVLAPGAPVVLTEVLNSSFFLNPYSPNLWRYWLAFNDFQHDAGGDPFVGAKLGNLLMAAGYRDIRTTVHTFHYDSREPAKRAAMIAFWEELLLSAADQLLAAGRVDAEVVEGMRQELREVQQAADAVFFFCFVQAQALA